jgi:hypothetical protein
LLRISQDSLPEGVQLCRRARLLMRVFSSMLPKGSLTTDTAVAELRRSTNKRQGRCWQDARSA